MAVFSLELKGITNHIGTKGALSRIGVSLFMVFFLILSVSWVQPEPKTQPPPPPEENETNFKFKSLYCWKFIKFIEWPSSYRQGSFEIAVLGDSPIQKYFEEWQNGREVGSQKIVVKKYSNSGSIAQPHIIYIPRTKSKDIGSVLKKLSGKSSLIITEQDGMANQGSMINFVVINSRVRFEINKSNVEKYNLQVSSSLLELSTKVYDK